MAIKFGPELIVPLDMCDFTAYTGKNDAGRCIGLGAKVVKNLAEPLKRKGCSLIFDNHFLQLICSKISSVMVLVALQRHELIGKKWPQELKSLSLDRGQHKSVMVNN